MDLIVVGEWMSIKIMINEHGKLIDKSRDWLGENTSGWWNVITGEDYDNGVVTSILSWAMQENNNQFKVSADHPITMVYKDFDETVR
ncbi:MAG: hypothetical protein IPF93_14410 [Saprospiraceae bacterium]|nr:hypothetical protein [Saprospiraceae bacterium]